jgi:hypothetical protein
MDLSQRHLCQPHDGSAPGSASFVTRQELPRKALVKSGLDSPQTPSADNSAW